MDAPRSTSRSLRFPTAGLAPKPLVAAAALDAQHQIGDVTGLPGYPGGVRHHLAGHADRLFDGFERAALLLDAEGDDGLVGDLENALPQLTVRDVFTAQADDYDAVDVGVGGKAH